MMGPLLAPWEIALTLVGKYQLGRKLATGGMAEVFLAKAEGPMGFEKTLVLKRILPHLAEDPQFVGMFLSEARLAAQLNHPNIVQIFDFGQAESTYYLAMEYIDGVDLRTLSLLARQKGVQLPPPICAKIVSSACEGLAFAHDFVDPGTGKPLNLIHRDISPDNILLSRQGAVKVVDFGIAKASTQGHKTQTGLVKGKIAYMPIEQLQGQPLDRRVDVYSLGIVLYELLTGQRPFDASTDVSMMQAILFEPLVPVTARRADLPPALTQILDRAICKVREQRYPDCRAFQADLERYILSTGEPIGPWQLAQAVTQLCTEAAGTPLEVSGFAATAMSAARDEGGQRESTFVSGQSEAPSMVMASSTEPPKPLPPATDRKVAPALAAAAVEQEDAARAIRPNRPGLWLALGGLALLAAGGGVVLFGRGTPVAPPPPVVAAPTPSALPPAEPVPAAPPSTPVVAAPVTPPTEVPAPEVPAAPPEPAPVAQAEPPAAPVVRRKEPQKGKLEFRIRPYATVLLDGTALGQTPLAPVNISAGPHTLRLINRELGKDVTRTVEVKGGKSTIFKLDLTAE
jgi:serine/threonine-protein kinase